MNINATFSPKVFTSEEIELTYLSDWRLVYDHTLVFSIPLAKQLIERFGATPNYFEHKSGFEPEDIRHMIDQDEASSVILLNGSLGTLIEYEIAWGNTNYPNVASDFKDTSDASVGLLIDLQDKHRAKLPLTSFFISERVSDEMASLHLCAFTPFEFDGQKCTSPYSIELVTNLHDYVHKLFNETNLSDRKKIDEIWCQIFNENPH
ncbi:hypothetical protein [Vibrio sp. D431a]|uniref:hypothetical protein n=1 Tax=Vibrio sp. D431a TaxID=2837388 RepID=UPI00255514F7|nr:hypothetical protein [Vibrio sp. D431a]MDK9793709.1 hypothetical protein [Vibrio sp. D431a]